jgi:hypothetical protein
MARIAPVAVMAGILSMAGTTAKAAQDWTRYGKEQGLPDEAVRALCLDGEGRLWAGLLAGGLAVYDGTRFVAHEPARLGTPHVRSLAWSRRGELWAATDAGALRVSAGPAERLDAGHPGLLSADLDLVVPDVAGKTWLVPFFMSYGEKAGVSAWDGQRLESFEAPEGVRFGRVIAVVQAPEIPAVPAVSGATLVVSENGLFRAEAGALKPVPLEGTALWRPSPRAASEEAEARRLPPVYLLAARQSQDQTIWFVHPRAVIALDPGGFHEVLAATAGPIGPWLAQTSAGTIWAAGFNGPLFHLGQGKLLQTVALPLQSGESVDELYAGPGAGLWIATEGRPGGLLRAVPAGQDEGFVLERVAGLGGGAEPLSVNALLEPPEGGLWLAADNGLFRLSE